MSASFTGSREGVRDLLAFSRGRALPLGQLLDLADGQRLANRRFRQRNSIVIADQCARMAHRKLPAFDKVDYLVRQCKQALQIRDVAAGFVDHRGDIALAQPLLVSESPVGARLFDRIEIDALKVLDQRDRHDLALVEIADQ